MKAAAIILSGGKSSRMGTNKALLKINEKTNIERIAETLKVHFDDIILVTNDPETFQFLGLKMVRDLYPGKGPLAGIQAGLKASNYDVNFIVACDMPFVSGPLAKTLVGSSGNYDAVIPVINGRQHPLFAVYRKKIVTQVEKNLVDDRLAIKGLLDYLNVRYVTEKDLPDYSSLDLERFFFNMNQPNEYEDAKKWAEADL